MHSNRTPYITFSFTNPAGDHSRHYHTTFVDYRVYICRLTMTAVQPRPPHDLGPIHPPRIERRAVKNSVARHVNIRVDDQLDHDAPAILHEPRSYSIIESKGAAVVLVSGAGGGVSGPGGNQPNPLKQTLRTNTKGKNQQANINFPGIKESTPPSQTRLPSSSPSPQSAWTTDNRPKPSAAPPTSAPPSTTSPAATTPPTSR